MRHLTDNQIAVVSSLRNRGAGHMANMVELDWHRGWKCWLNPDNPAFTGIMKEFHQGNKEAEESTCPKST
jgi:hypothetical protein